MASVYNDVRTIEAIDFRARHRDVFDRVQYVLHLPVKEEWNVILEELELAMDADTGARVRVRGVLEQTIAKVMGVVRVWRIQFGTLADE